MLDHQLPLAVIGLTNNFILYVIQHIKVLLLRPFEIQINIIFKVYDKLLWRILDVF